MADKYSLHNDFKKVPVLNVKFSPLIIAPLNFLLRLTRVLAKRPEGVTIVPRSVTADDGEPIKVRVITPDNVQSDAPCLIYYHGGAFAMTFSSMHIENSARYARATGCIVVFVCYRLAMKNPFPDGFDDSYTALSWVVANARRLGVDQSRIAVGGDSAGGALAAGVAQKCRDKDLIQLCGQMLIYPVLDHRCGTTSATDFVDVPLWNAISNKRMWDMYLKNFNSSAPPLYATPGHGEVSNLPATYIETAEFDPLRDEGLNYAALLTAKKNILLLNETSGTIHGYDGYGKNEIVVASMQKRIDFLKTVFA
ncbi:alpha/beta hydrolase [Candidatus Marimicrobium litorale]|uniref:alpha/beta hydrolase n=1 Tax=Candidatus Marimicrobium litorale TaxID=2518991 RepID=UPI00242EF74B|nr:alpha/beta hydrolase [Candidatus Marimicrobium litorale]